MGLMGRRALPAGDGLWLPSSNGIHMFFMRFPIDAVFLARADGRRRRGRSCRVHAEPPAVDRASSRSSAAPTACLELPVGTIDATATAPGDTVRID